MKKYLLPSVGVLLVLIGIGTGLSFGMKASATFTPAPVDIRELSPEYKYIDPLIATETSQNLYPEYDAFDSEVNSLIDSAKSSGKASSVSVYIRDEKSGHWSGVNENQQYDPSSMLKVAVMIAYYRYAMDQAMQGKIPASNTLSQQLYYPGTDVSGLQYPPTHMLKPGYYSVNDLITAMITDSDNAATSVLFDKTQSEFQTVYKDFQLPITEGVVTGDYQMTAKSFSIIFRALYNASYLSRSFSEKALELLTQTTFNEGIVAGVPTGTPVAHKFGEHTVIRPDGSVIDHELHDCGIVYYPGHPYLLCVMTRGSDFTQLEDIIQSISKIAYNYVNGVNSQKNN